MLDVVSGHFRMYRRKSGNLPTKTGSISISTAIAAIMTASGMKAGKDILNW